MDLPKYIKNLSRFINDFCAISDGNEFLTLFKNTYPKELNLKAEHEGNHISILDLDSKIEDMVFVNKILTKKTNLHSLLSKYQICQAIYHLQFPMRLNY